MAVTTASTANAIRSAIETELGAGDTLRITPGTYTFTSKIERVGGVPNIERLGSSPVILEFAQTMEWTASGEEFWCSPPAGNVYAIPRGVIGEDGTLRECSRLGPYLYDFTSPPGDDKIRCGSWVPDTLTPTDFELIARVPHDMTIVRGALSTGVITCTDVLDGTTQRNIMAWVEDTPDYKANTLSYEVLHQVEGMSHGRWRFDRDAWRLYYRPMPGEDIEAVRVCIDARRGLDLRNTDNLNLFGITVQGTNAEPHTGPVGYSDCGAFWISNCNNATLDSLVARRCAGAGIRAAHLDGEPWPKQCDGMQIRNCHVAECGGQAVSVGGENVRASNISINRATLRLHGASAFQAENAKAFQATTIEVSNCPGCAFGVSVDNETVEEGPNVSRLTVTECGTANVTDRGSVYFIGGGGNPAVVTLTDLLLTRRNTTAQEHHGVYFDEGSYGTITRFRISGYGDGGTGRAIFGNSPDGPVSLEDGYISAKRAATIEMRNSSEDVILSNVRTNLSDGLTVVTDGEVTSGGDGPIGPGTSR